MEEAGDVCKVHTSKDTLGREQPRVRKVRPVASIYTPNEKAEKQARQDIAVVTLAELSLPTLGVRANEEHRLELISKMAPWAEWA
jgi:hypothetical protein